jgi:hypothetical protein
VAKDGILLNHALQEISHEQVKYRDRGSPCRKPRLQLIHFPETPLSRIADIDEVKIASIQSHQVAGNPRASITTRKLPQSIESNALDKSNFSTTDGTFLL